MDRDRESSGFVTLAGMLDLVKKLLGKPRQRPAWTLALYGPRNDALDLLAGLDWVQNRVKDLGLPDAEWITWNYGAPGDRHYKTYKLASWIKRGRLLPDAACTSVEIGKFVEGSKQGRTDDIWYASLDSEQNFILSVDLAVVALEDAVVTDFVVGIQALGSFEYGYVFQMPMERSPATYERGLLFGTPSTGLTVKQENEVSKWGSARGGCGDYLDDEITRYLRDIYPLNFLNPHHLAMRVKGGPLKDWIEADSARGNLRPLIEGKLWVWAVPETRIQAIRKVLGPERLLISWGDFNTPSGGPLGHTYGARKDSDPVFSGKPLTRDDERWIASGLVNAKQMFARYTGEPPEHFDQLIASRQPLFGKLLDMTFSAWSHDSRPDRLSPEDALHAFAAALGEHLVSRYRMGWYVLDDEHGRCVGVCHRGPGGSQTWSYPIDAVAKRIDSGETGFMAALVEAVGEQTRRA